MERIIVIVLGAWLAASLPIPLLDRLLTLRELLVALATVFMVGKTIYDTLFYDHFRP